MWLEVRNSNGKVVIEDLDQEGRDEIISLCHRLINEVEELGYNEHLDELTEEELSELVRCRECGCYVKPSYGAVSPGHHQDASGTADDPRAPGDYNDICAVCDYTR